MNSNTISARDAGGTVHDALFRASRRLHSRLEAELLLARALERERAWLYAHGSDQLTPGEAAAAETLIERRAAGEPVAYLLGAREFHGRPFAVDEAVLIPRPETELLVELALDLPLPERARVVDVGTGSGCIALTLAAERPDWRICAVDSSPQALAVASLNRERLALDRVELLAGDLLEPTYGRTFDLVVSNPPYVAEADPHLDLGDLRFEPRQALAAGLDGLDLIRRLVSSAPAALAAGGWLLLEHGHDQAGRVRELVAAAGFEGIRSHHDLAGIERVTLGCLPG